MITVDGRVFQVGDTVRFMSDIEQYGIIYEIEGSRLYLRAESPSGFGGEYIGGDSTTIVYAEDCWLG